MENAQSKFLKSVNVENEIDALGNCVRAAFGRNRIYKKDINQYRRENLRCDLKSELLLIAEPYRETIISEAKHEENIQELSNRLTKKHSAILKEDCFKIGTSQKALNLFLKFLWCLGKLPGGLEPVHCPLDGVILKKASIYKAWTKLNEIEVYRKWITKIRSKISPNSLSSWELAEWNKFAKNRMIKP